MASTTVPLTGKGKATRERLLDCARQEAVATGGHLEIASVAERAGVVPSLLNPPPGCRFANRCRYASDACRSAEPAARLVAPGHIVACIL